jgi:tRNA (guanine-N7-)-methyltransferase
VGTDRSRAGAEGSLGAVKPPPDRLYGRSRGHKLRTRQEVLLNVALPRLQLREADAADPLQAFFPPAFKALWLEVGFGGGEHALAQVRTHPDVALIACEVFDNGVCSLLSALVPEGSVPEGNVPDGPELSSDPAEAALPANLRLWTNDARILLRVLPDRCLDRLFLLFPDPWPKARHAKRRFVHPAMLPLLARVLKPGGEWRVASDDPTYQAWVADVMAAQTLFTVAPPQTRRPSDWPPTRYEAKALRAERECLYWVFRCR